MVLVVVAPSDSFKKDFEHKATHTSDIALVFESEDILDEINEWVKRTGKIVGSSFRKFRTLDEALKYVEWEGWMSLDPPTL